ncbi:thymidine phosphorylase [Streptomyces sp. NPDC058459]|uniref:thymidine phosphorylase n=1 Tax=Streptomyces sp. NPDC058459 TaxID=3346508 RepID=UPI00365889FE
MTATTDPVADAAASARIQSAVVAKRLGGTMKPADIRAVIDDFVAGRVPDYQMAAWLATVACSGLDMGETAALTEAYVAGGQLLDLKRLGRTVLDKHSTGGVGDKVSMIVVPIVAACGVAVVKMSGRGLGHAGGTIDKLESVPGLRLDLDADEIYEVIDRVGMVITGQSAALAPGDGATYALRDVTGTVESIPLIAASIISKKVAVGADGLVLDVKTGAGALIPDREKATLLAESMIELAGRFGLGCQAVLSDMSQPLGRAVGNALEVKEALAVLQGEEVPGLSELCRTLAGLMLRNADPELSDTAADEAITAALTSGAAHRRFLDWAAAQGGDVRVLESPELLPIATYRRPVLADHSGWVQHVDPRAVGMAALHVGAGRLAHNARLDLGSGVVVLRRVGDAVRAGEPLAELHCSTASPDTATDLLAKAFTIGDAPVTSQPVIHRVFT